MPKWTEYTSKDTLADNDEVMLYDATARANKRGLMSKFWDYVVDKMSTAVISKLETENKTVIGALNYLNGNTSRLYISMTKNIADFNSKYTTTNERLRILYGIIEDTAYISFDVNWIRIQLKADASNIFVRIVYGGNQIGNWVQIK
jgi:hypothetical protein